MPLADFAVNDSSTVTMRDELPRPCRRTGRIKGQDHCMLETADGSSYTTGTIIRVRDRCGLPYCRERWRVTTSGTVELELPANCH